METNAATVRSWIVGLALALTGSVVSAEPIVFNAVYADTPGTGFLAAGAVGARRRTAFEAALASFEGLLEASYAGEYINVQASFGATGFLAEAGPTWAGRDYAGMLPSTWYGGALAAHVNGQDLTLFPTEPHIWVLFNEKNIDGVGQEFYFGTDANPPSPDLDFITLAMHEVSHGLAFDSEIWSGGDGTWEDFVYPGVFDHFVYDPKQGKTLAEMTDTERAAAISGPGAELVWIGSNAVAANGGVAPRLYVPQSWAPGSSITHWDLFDYPDDNLNPLVYNPFVFPPGANHELSAITLGVFEDVGWNVATPVPEPGSLVLLGAALAVLVIYRLRARHLRIRRGYGSGKNPARFARRLTR